jgi:hypothetical protein
MKNRAQSGPAVGAAEAQLALHAISEGAEDSMHECPMAINAKAIGSRSRSSDTATIDYAAASKSPALALVEPAQLKNFSFRHNKGSTHLRCCVFLI